MPTRVRKIALPTNSLLHGYMSDDDFVDCFAAPATISPRQAAEIIVEFPGWAQPLLKLRSLITSPFGLSQDGPEAADKLGPFPVDQETEHEIIAGFDDKHLNFRVSVMCRDGRLSLATWVHPHNFGGRLYLATILPFHILIARNGVARAAAAQTPPLATAP